MPPQPEVERLRARIQALREQEARIGTLLVQHHARLAVITGDTDEVRQWCRVVSLPDRVMVMPPRVPGECAVCGGTTERRRSTCSDPCRDELRARGLRAAVERRVAAAQARQEPARAP